MAIAYTSTDQVFLDTLLYLLIKQSKTLNLGLFPKIAENRWNWLVNDWPKYKKIFKDYAAGNEQLTSKYADLEKEVLGFKTGSRINPFSAGSRFFKYRSFLELISLSELKLTANESQVESEERLRITSLSEDDFKNMIKVLNNQILDITQEVGLGDDDALAIYGIQQKPAKRSATISDLKKISQLKSSVQIVRGLIFDARQKTRRPPNLLRAANENISDDSSVEVLDIYYTYKPIVFEISLQHIAKKYLGNANRWYELVTINNLKPPFIDEIGTKYSILAPPAENSLLISSNPENEIFIGAKIKLGSNAKREAEAVIQQFTINEDNTISVVVFSETANINDFLPKDDAYVRIFLPSTVRKGSQILIPSTIQAAEEISQLTPQKDFLRKLDSAFIQFGVDISRNEYTGDFEIDNSGNFRLSYGVKAVRQAVLNALKIKTGELNFHPGYGLTLRLGSQYFGSNAEVLAFSDLLRSSILKDQRFESVTINNLNKTESSLAVQFIVKIKGLSDPIPLAFIG